MPCVGTGQQIAAVTPTHLTVPGHCAQWPGTSDFDSQKTDRCKLATPSSPALGPTSRINVDTVEVTKNVWCAESQSWGVMRVRFIHHDATFCSLFNLARNGVREN